MMRPFYRWGKPRPRQAASVRAGGLGCWHLSQQALGLKALQDFRLVRSDDIFEGWLCLRSWARAAEVGG